jgi:hypothetical protein
MTTNLNITPYYDDFDKSKNFQQILFKPGYPVQARELTQAQSILRNQIAQFGSHVFTQGSVVIPGNSNSDFNVSYVKLDPTVYDMTTIVGKVLVGANGALRGLVKAYTVENETDPLTVFVSYYNTGSDGAMLFAQNETLTIEGTIYTLDVMDEAEACGGAVLANINRGVFFVNGTFVEVNPQTIPISKYSSVPHCHVLLKIEESIVNSNVDESLLDPAQGSYNYSAPGADRLKIDLVLIALPYDIDTPSTDNYVELMRYNDGVLEEHLRYSKYNELEKNLARRTNDEAGDYVVSGLKVTQREHLRTPFNGGRYPEPVGDADKMVYTVNKGRAYIKGFETEVFSNKELIVDKGRTADHIKEIELNVVPSYGQYIYVSNLVKQPLFTNQETISIYNGDGQPGTTGVIIATAKAIALDYVEPNTNENDAIYKLFITDLNVDQFVGKIPDFARFTTPSGATGKILSVYAMSMITDAVFSTNEVVSTIHRNAKVHKYNKATSTLYGYMNGTAKIGSAGDTITGVTSAASGKILSATHVVTGARPNLLIPVPISAIYKLKHQVVVAGEVVGEEIDLSYKSYYSRTVECPGSGTVSVSVSGRTFDPIEQGNFIASTDTGVIPQQYASLSVDGYTLTLSNASLANKTIYISATTTTASLPDRQYTPKTKTLVSSFIDFNVIPYVNSNGVTVADLTKADGIQLRSVTYVDGGNIIDVTNDWKFNNGQTDCTYELSYLTFVGSVPHGPIEVTYDYFAHSGASDYFCVDSYEYSGLPDYYTSSALKYFSKNDGKTYDLTMTMDFRSTVGADGTLAGSGSQISFPPQQDSRINGTVQHYVTRLDKIILNKDGAVTCLRGTPDERPSLPNTPEGALFLASVMVPAYTFSISQLRIVNVDNRGYTMRDIGKISTRLNVLENTVALNAAETGTVNLDVIDAATGISKFKAGFLIDEFDNPDTIANVTDSEFKVTYISGNIVPQFEVFESVAVDRGSWYIPPGSSLDGGRLTGTVWTLPYTEVVMASQPVSSRITNINPFAVFQWIGTMVINPRTDTWTDTTVLPSVTNVNTTVLQETVVTQRPHGWIPPAGANVYFEPDTTIVQLIPGNRVNLWWETFDAMVAAGALGDVREVQSDEAHLNIGWATQSAATGRGIYENTTQDDWTWVNTNGRIDSVYVGPK